MKTSGRETGAPLDQESPGGRQELTSLLPGLSPTNMAHVMASHLAPEDLERITRKLVGEFGYRFATLVARNNAHGMNLDYWFYHVAGMPWLRLHINLVPGCCEAPSKED